MACKSLGTAMAVVVACAGVMPTILLVPPAALARGGMDGPPLPPPVLTQMNFPCPGPLNFEVTLATPGGQVALVFAANIGSFVIPNNFPCAGTVLGLGSQNIQLVQTLNANAAGVVVFSGLVPPFACLKYLQAVDINTCTTSNVVQIL